MTTTQIKVVRKALTDGSVVYDMEISQDRQTVVFALPGDSRSAYVLARKIVVTLEKLTLESVALVEA